MPQWNNMRKDLAFGVTAIGVLASASAVLNILSEIVATPLSGWLESILQWYRNLFFPIVENTIGIVPRIFGFNLLAWAKDLIVVYLIFGSTVARTSHSFYQRRGEFKILPPLVAMITWPLALFIVIYDSFLEEDENERIWTRQIAKTMATQLAYVVVVVFIAMIFNAADILP